MAFWNGALGAFVGALVALVVVLLTGAMQRRQTRESREIEAIAGFISAMGRAYEEIRANDHSKPRELMITLLASTVRLRLASPGASKIAAAVEAWPSAIELLAADELTAQRREVYLGVNVRMLISDAYAKALNVVPAWQSGNAAKKRKCLEELKDMTQVLVESAETAEQAIRDSARSSREHSTAEA
ncbi:hypothetical protein [Paenarthrobacter sp. NPDC091669]|uniref:hypothetical protein n=1 Tax=Paenarthrobacter sp. NPDC091669 TaxID=3364384 RepID=UPI003801BB68